MGTWQQYSPGYSVIRTYRCKNKIPLTYGTRYVRLFHSKYTEMCDQNV